MFSFAIVIPCYNEAKRFPKDDFFSIIEKHKEILFVFVNDGSSDKTQFVIENIAKRSSDNVFTLQLHKNSGKGAAVMNGVQFILNNYEIAYIGYFDADLSIPFNELIRIYQIALQDNADFAIGSKIKKLDTQIERTFFRHIISRFIATIINLRFHLGCYDTQCGAKVFSKEVLDIALSKPFVTQWFFDVEILLRIRAYKPFFKGREVPLCRCDMIKNSKLSVLSSFKVITQLITLLIKY